MKKKIKLESIKNSRGKTDWNYLKNLKEPSTHDVNAPALTQNELNQLKKPGKILNK